MYSPLQEKYASLQTAHDSLKKELQKCVASLIATQQKSVETVMQGLDFKHEVHRRGDLVLQSIVGRMGFVPAGIQKQMLLLKALKVRKSYVLSSVQCNVLYK